MSERSETHGKQYQNGPHLHQAGASPPGEGGVADDFEVKGNNNMTPLTVNLKIFYQRKTLWVFYILILCQIPQLFSGRKPPKPMIIIIISFLAGIIVAGSFCDLMKRPVTYCLPGDRRLPVKSLLTIGLILNGLLALIFISTLNIYMSPGMQLLKIVAVGLLGLMCYLLSSLSAYCKGSVYEWVGVVFNFLILFFFIGHKNYFDTATPGHLLLLLSLSLIVSLFCLHYINRPGHHRRLCGSDIADVFGNGFSADSRRRRAVIAATKNTAHGQNPTWLEKLTVTRMKETANPRWKTTWGELYTNLCQGFAISQMWKMIIIISFFILMHSYTYSHIHNSSKALAGMTGGMANIIYIFPIFMLIHCQIPAHPTLLIPAGRQEKFRSSLTTAVIITLFLTSIMAIIVGIFHLVAPYMPEISGSRVRVFIPPVLSRLLILPVCIPIGFIISILIQRKQFVVITIIVLFIYVIVMASSFYRQYIGGSLIIPILIGVVLWLLFVAILQRHCKKGNLVGPGQ